jgi:protoheme IX farnesyltransferase
MTDTTAPTPSLFKDIAVLFKLRLGTFVVLSAVLGWFMGAETIALVPFLKLTIGGYLLTGASNGFNQIIERSNDAKMGRTAGRPLPTGRMSVRTAATLSTVAGAIGLAALFDLGVRAGLLGLLAISSYVLAYTPLKSRTGFSVLVGAIPGAIPPMLGYVAATHRFGIEPGTLFAVQFMWQFPHFWAIAWVAHEDYLKAGYRMLPFKEGRSAASARQILMYTMLCIPASLLPWALPGGDAMVGNVAFAVAILAGLGFCVPAYQLWRSRAVEDARKLMFASFLYLPIVQLTYVLDKIP